MTESNSTSFTKPELPMTIQTIREYLPHRYPFLLVDRVVEIVPGERISPIKIYRLISIYFSYLIYILKLYNIISFCRGFGV